MKSGLYKNYSQFITTRHSKPQYNYDNRFLISWWWGKVECSLLPKHPLFRSSINYVCVCTHSPGDGDIKCLWLRVSHTPSHGRPLHRAEVLVWRGASNRDLVESLEYLLRAVVIETNTCDRGGMETEEIRLTNLRTPGGIGIEDLWNITIHIFMACCCNVCVRTLLCSDQARGKALK